MTNELSLNLNNEFSFSEKYKLQIRIILPVIFMDLSKFHRVNETFYFTFSESSTWSFYKNVRYIDDI